MKATLEKAYFNFRPHSNQKLLVTVLSFAIARSSVFIIILTTVKAVTGLSASMWSAPRKISELDLWAGFTLASRKGHVLVE